MRKLNFVGIWTCAILTTSLAADANYYEPLAENAVSKDWWETAAFYQIYPRSYKDSNGDGIGDLNGINEMLPYVMEIGIKAFWLSPIFKSPMADFGYDISDFYKIQPEYGTMEDFDMLVQRAKMLNLKVILDFVPNHSSNESDWFAKSVRREPGFENFYVWHPGKPNPVNGSRPLPPNNWVSMFRYSAWQWSDERKEYYYHAFLPQQPDLNYRNPKVVDEMKNVLRFWLDRGVDGFRIDAVPSVFEVTADSNGNYPDEPKSGNTDDPNDPAYLNHIYTQDQPETIHMVYQWRAVMDEYQKQNGGETRVIMTETYSPIDVVMQYYGNDTVNGAHIPFNFQLIMNIHNNSNATDFKRVIDLWMDKMPENRTANWVMGNHDQNRVASRYGTEKIDAINMILLTLPGASVTYNGEEIGMTDVVISWADTVDPQACNTNSSVYEKVSRDPERTPFQWNSQVNAGFSNGVHTWLPVSPDYKILNVENQVVLSNSHLRVFVELTNIRNAPFTDTLRNGNFQSFVFNNVFVILRQLKNDDNLITVANLGETNETVDLSKLGNLPSFLQYVVVSISSHHERWSRVKTDKVLLAPHESFVLGSRSKDYYEYKIEN